MNDLSERVLLTAGGGRIKSPDSPESQILFQAVNFYKEFGAEVIVATSVSDDRAISDLFSGVRSPEVNFVSVPNGAKGALATANFALAKLGIKSGKLHIGAGDTTFTGESALQAMGGLSSSHADAGTLIFPSGDERHSFVSITDSRKVQFVAEKRRVSNWATSGNFYFSDARQFLEASDWCFTNNASFRDNFYVSSALNYFVYQGLEVLVKEIESQSIVKLWSSP